jgi:hypothetical protein
LDGIDEPLHEGVLRAVPLEGDHRYAVDFDWLLSTALGCLDTVEEYDGKGTGEVDGLKVDGLKVDVTIEGWRVLGWKFDDDGNTLEEFEKQGHGSNAPKSAFQHP